MANQNNTINYIEIPMQDKDATEKFFSTVFGWEFKTWSPNYMTFTGAGLMGGFSAHEPNITAPGVRVIMFADDLEAKCKEVEEAGGEIVQPIFEMPTGKRFHFKDPNGNEFGVVST